MKTVVIYVAMLLLSGCAVNGYKQFYTPYGDVSQIPAPEFLAEGAEPKVMEVGPQEVDKAVRTMRAKGFIPIGYSSFNGQYQGADAAKEQARSLKALVVLVTSKYTDTQTSTVPLYMPTQHTTYGSGSAYGSGGFASYSGSSTTYGSTIVPVTTQQRRYDQAAMYFVKSGQKARFGVQLQELSPEQRKSLGRNTGALIDVVLEGTPAFYANVMDGDVLIEIDGKQVRDIQGAMEIMKGIDQSQQVSIFKVIRGSEEKEIEVRLL